jgi:hypothetical protein
LLWVMSAERHLPRKKTFQRNSIISSPFSSLLSAHLINTPSAKTKEREPLELMNKWGIEWDGMRVGLERKHITIYSVIWRVKLFNEGGKPNETHSIHSINHKTKIK